MPRTTSCGRSGPTPTAWLRRRLRWRAKLIVRDAHCREIAEARVHSVHRVVTLGHLRDDLGRLLHRSLGRAVEADSDVAPRHLDHIRDREVVTREAEGRYFTFSR